MRKRKDRLLRVCNLFALQYQRNGSYQTQRNTLNMLSCATFSSACRVPVEGRGREEAQSTRNLLLTYLACVAAILGVVEEHAKIYF